MKRNKKVTLIQGLTLIAIVFYILWEFVFLSSWKENTEGPLIRVDLLIIYPLIVIGLVISIIQIFRKKK